MNRYDLFKYLVDENGPFIIDAVDKKSDPVFSLCIDKVSFSDGSEAIKVKQLIYVRPYKEANEKTTPIVFAYHLKKDGDILINQKEVENNASLRVGIDYEIIKYLNIRIGAMNEPSSFSAGIGINYSIFEIDYALFNHQDLGFTHQLGVTLQFGGDKSRNERIKKYLSEK